MEIRGSLPRPIIQWENMLILFGLHSRMLLVYHESTK